MIMASSSSQSFQWLRILLNGNEAKHSFTRFSNASEAKHSTVKRVEVEDGQRKQEELNSCRRRAQCWLLFYIHRHLMFHGPLSWMQEGRVGKG